jgi:hypothetical protein
MSRHVFCSLSRLAAILLPELSSSFRSSFCCAVRPSCPATNQGAQMRFSTLVYVLTYAAARQHSQFSQPFGFFQGHRQIQRVCFCPPFTSASSSPDRNGPHRHTKGGVGGGDFNARSDGARSADTLVQQTVYERDKENENWFLLSFSMSGVVDGLPICDQTLRIS